MKMSKALLPLMALALLAGCSDKVTNNFSGETAGQKGSVFTQSKRSAQDGEAEYTQNGVWEKDFNYILAKGTLPKAESDLYLSIIEKKNPETKKKQVKISGVKVVLDSASKIKIFHLADLESVLIEADELVVADNFNFAGAKVTLKARKLTFTDNGKISTTPTPSIILPEPTKDGKKGDNAGDLYLDVREIDFGLDSKIRFDLSGGKGQAAGLGIIGMPGTSVVPLEGNAIRICTNTIVTCFEREIGTIVVSESESCTGGAIPTNGEAGTVAGRPGAGGNGGFLSIAHNLSVPTAQVNLLSGPSGEIAPDTKGGSAGTPVQFTTAFRTVNRSKGMCSSGGRGGKAGNNNFVTKSVNNISGETQNGPTLKSPTTPAETSAAGNMLLTFSGVDYTETFLSMKLSYAKDLYRNNYFAEAEKELSELNEIFSKLKNTESYVGLVEKESALLFGQLHNHLDIDGYPLNYVPNLSMQKLARAYRAEIKGAFETLNFTNFFIAKVDSVKSKSQKIYSNKEKFEKEIDLYSAQNRIAHVNAREVENTINEVVELNRAFEVALKEVERQIEDEARRNIHSQEKKKKLLNGVKLLATLAKVCPAGQPAAAAIGMGIDAAIAASQKDGVTVTDIMQEGYGIYKNLKGVDWRASKEDWDNKYRALYFDKFKEAHPEIEGKKLQAYLKNLVNTTKPMFQATAKYYEENFKNQVPRNDYEKEVARIKSIHPKFKEMTDKLSELQQKKDSLNSLLATNMSMIRETESKITDSILAISAAQSAYNDLLTGIDFTVEDALKFYEKSAKERLLKYKALLVKSYSYRLLKPWKGNLNLEGFEKSLANFENADSGKTSLEYLEKVYKEDLKVVAKDVFEQLSNGELKEYISEETLTLNKGELAALKAGRSIVIDLEKRIQKPDHEENKRLISLHVDDVEMTKVSDSGSFDFIASHTGKSNLTKGGTTYFFVHETATTNWVTRLGEDLQLRNLVTTNLEDSLFAIFLDDYTVEREDLNEKVAVNSKFIFKVTNTKNIKALNYLKLKFMYSFSLKN